MTEPEIYRALTEIFRDLLADESITLRGETTAADVEGWDSMNNINLMVAAEDRFGIRFSVAEIESFKNVGDLVGAIASKA